MSTDLDLTQFKALSFVCYGALIDWEAGIAAALAPWAREQRLDLSDEALLLAYARSTTTPRPSAKACRRSESTAATPGPAGGRRPSSARR